MGATRGGGAKGFWKQFGTGLATPFVAIGKRFNPQLASKGNETNISKTKDFSRLREASLNKKLGKVENKFTSKNSFSYVKPKTKTEMKHNKKVGKQGKAAFDFVKHTKKQNDRQKKWDEKAAKKADKKSGK